MAPTDGKYEKVTGWVSLVCHWPASNQNLRNLNQIKVSVLEKEMMGLIHTVKAVGPKLKNSKCVSYIYDYFHLVIQYS